MKPSIALILTLVTLASFLSPAAQASDWYCCIQSTLDRDNHIQHEGQSKYCVMNNSEEMPEVRPNVFAITKYDYTFQVDPTATRNQSISITHPNGHVQTGPERELIRGLMWDLFIGTFGAPQYQFVSETAKGFNLDCSRKTQ